ncbi:hypothetical protein AHF37_01296 [Paragonimus kellicotti]|nr:hypothetical protein AHF37_01296 [Paragonimus kellicotti]
MFVRSLCLSVIRSCSCFSAVFYAALVTVPMFPDSMNPFADPHSLIGAVPLDKPPRSRSSPIPSTASQWSSSHHTTSGAPASSDVAVLNDDTVDQPAPDNLTVKYTAKPHGHDLPSLAYPDNSFLSHGPASIWSYYEDFETIDWVKDITRDRLNYIIPLMVATMISKWTGDRLTKGSIYEEQIRLNGYPYLGEHDELEHMWIAADVMQPSDPDSPLFVITQDGMTVLDLETLLNTSDVKGFPVVVSQQSPYLVGWVTRRDLRWALDHERHLDATISDDSPIYFTNYSCDIQVDEAGPVPLCFRNVVDLKSFLGCLRCYWDSGSGWFCVLAVGLITGIIACVIDIGSTWMSDLKEGVCVEAFWFNREQCCWSSNQTDGVCDQWFTWSRLFLGKDPTGQNPEAYFVGYLFYICFAILFAGICVFLVRMFAPYACGSGIAEIKTILGGFIIRGFLGKWTLLIKSVGMILGVASGLSLGKEGPMVHIATCVGNIVAYLFPKYGRNEAKKREILSASAAAAVAVAFGAPIGGVLFSLEEASYYFPMKTMFRSFFCAMVSANVLHMLNPYGSDTMIMFSVDYKAQWHVMELFPFALLGLLGVAPVREVLVVATVTALVSFPHAYLRMDTSALIKLLVSPCSPVDDMSICDYRINLSDPMGNVLGSYPSGPTMSTAMILLLTGLFLKLVLTIFTIGIKVPTGLFIPSLAVRDWLAHTYVKGFPVVVSQQSPYLVGWVTRRDLRWALDHERHLDATISDDSPIYFTNYSCDIQVDEAGPVPPCFRKTLSSTLTICFQNPVHLTYQSPTTVTDQTPMETVLDFFRKLGLRQIVVTHNGCLLGILTKKDVLRHLLRHSRMR